MTAFSSEALRFHEQLADDYISRIFENGIEDAETYFEQVNAFEDGRITEEDRVRKFLSDNKVPLEAFYRVAPTRDQDVMMATLNPGMQNTMSLSTFTDGEYGRQHDVGTNLEEKAVTVASNLDGFLTHRDNMFSDLIEGLRSELDLMNDSKKLEDYLDYDENSFLDHFFGDVCYTWMYKLATPDDGHINSIGGPSRSEARKWFAKEIFDIVDPKLLVSVGKHGWVTVWEYLSRNYSENPEELIEGYSENVPVVKSYNSTYGTGAYAGLFRVEAEDLWIITTWHASMWIKADRLRENACMLNEELQ